MTDKFEKFLQKDFDWDTFDGQVEGHSMDHDWTVEITARPTARDIKWGAADTNVRTWTVYLDYVEWATGEADGVRAAKTAALEAINTSGDDLR